MNVIELLKSHQLKKTAPRVAILNVLNNSKIPQSESEIKQAIGDLYDRITFYRSMHSLIEVGMIHKIVIDNTLVKYALNNCSDEHVHEVDHVHFFCNKCNSVMCLEQVKTASYQLPDGFLKNECDVVIKGCCNSCQADVE
jgi:Fur family ferric uptake transcriptional regulator